MAANPSQLIQAQAHKTHAAPNYHRPSSPGPGPQDKCSSKSLPKTQAQAEGRTERREGGRMGERRKGGGGVHTHTHTHTHNQQKKHTHTHRHTHAQTQRHTGTHTHTHTQTHTHTHTHTRTVEAAEPPVRPVRLHGSANLDARQAARFSTWFTDVSSFKVLDNPLF